MGLFDLLRDLVSPPPLRTLCCGVAMDDLWMHAASCPNFQAALARVRANGGGNLPFVRGDQSGRCPRCGFPAGHYGLYTVGERCSYCGYIERRG